MSFSTVVSGCFANVQILNLVASGKILKAKLLFSIVSCKQTYTVNWRNNDTMEWLSEVRYVGVLMPESCCPGSNSQLQLISVLIESHAD